MRSAAWRHSRSTWRGRSRRRQRTRCAASPASTGRSGRSRRDPTFLLGTRTTSVSSSRGLRPRRRTALAYDALGRLTRTTHPDGNFVAKSYGVWSETTYDEHGHPTTIRLDAYGRTVLQERYLSGQPLQTRSTYDALGRLIGLADPGGNAWSWTYDWLGRNTAKRDPDAGTWMYQYDDAGRVMSQADAKKQQTQFTYDGAGRLASRSNAAGTTTIGRSEVRAGYFNAGQVTTVSSPGGVLKIDYDALGRAVRQIRTLDG